MVDLQAPGCQPPGATERFQPQMALCDAFGRGGSRGGHARTRGVDDPRSVLQCGDRGKFRLTVAFVAFTTVVAFSKKKRSGFYRNLSQGAMENQKIIR